MSPAQKPTVLLIEADSSLRRLLVLGLQHRGMQVIEASSLAELALLSASQPDLLVIDVDSGVHSDWSSLEALQSDPLVSSLPAVALAWDAQPVAVAQSVSALATRIYCLSKPFDARTLHDTIDQLLTASAARKADAQAKAEAALLASYPPQSAPSIWPLATAAGLLLVVVGMLGQAALAAIGILIVLASLALWVFGLGQEHSTMALL